MKYVRRKSFGPFEVVAHLDTGGMAEVYLARHHIEESLAVVKLILEHYRAHKELLQMFRLEGRIMTLLDHPNVVKVIGTGDDQSGLPYIVMEYLAGDNLGVLLRASQKHHKPMTPSLIARIAIQVANGLSYVHEATDRKRKPLDLVHRDVSPQNIVLCYDGRVKLLDFGVAHTSRRGVSTDSGLLKGKLNYMSPEQIQGERFDGRSDIFALGIVMWQMITGKSLFHSEIDYNIMKMITEEPIPAPRDERPDVPKALDAIVMRCLERPPQNRFQSAAELRRVLSHFLFFGGQQGSANELPLFTDHVLGRRKRKKKSIITSIRREMQLRERLFGDLGDELLGFEWLEEKRREKAFTPVKPVPDPSLDGEDAYSTSDVRCEWCGAKIKVENLRPGAERRCEWCRESTGEILLEETGPVWMVRKPDRSTSGPLTIMQVMQKFEAGEIEASDLLARKDSDFRLISSYPEFAPFFQLPGREYNAPPGRRWYQNAVILAVLILMIAGAAVWFLTTRPSNRTVSVMERTLDKFSKEIQSPSGTSSQAVAQGRKLMLADNHNAYARADKAFKEALLLNSENRQALADWVQNKAMLDFGYPDAKQRKEALDLIDYALQQEPLAPELHRARAYLFYSLGNNAPALESATRAFELGDKENPENLLILGAVHLEAEPELAAKYLKEALEADPNLLLANRLLARAKIRLGKFREALLLLKKRLKRAPGEFETQKTIAEIYLSVGQMERATETYQKILHPKPLQAEPLVRLARIQSQLLRQPALALKTTQDFLETHADLSKTDRALVMAEQSVALRLLGKRKQAEKIIDDALKQDPTCVVARYAQAVLEHELGRNESALSHLRALRVELPQSARVLARMAEVLSLIPNFEAAQKDLRRALDLQPRDLDIHLMLAGLHLYLDNPTQAYEQLDQALGIDPFYDEIHRQPTAFFDGPFLLRLTVRRIKKPTSKFSSNPLTHALQGIVLYRNGNTKKARTSLLKALELDADCFPANLYLGTIELQKDQPKEAWPYLKRARQSRPSHPIAARLLAKALLGQKKVKQAKALLKRVLRTNPEDSVARLTMAEVYLAGKKKRKAIRTLAKAIQQDPDNQHAKQLLFRLGH